jgi:predicted  nucleic acid-binding Zn-ribbon protein
LNTNHETFEKILKLDLDAATVTADIRQAERQLTELSKKTAMSKEAISVSKKEMTFYESEARRLYKKMDMLEDKRTQKSEKIAQSKSEDDHRYLKREIDQLERESRDALRKIDDLEANLEKHKHVYQTSQKELGVITAATEAERRKAQDARENSSEKLAEIEKVRNNYLSLLDDRFSQHYSRVAKVTRNPNGPINRVNNKACGNCYMELTPQIMTHLSRKNNVEICPNCHHILIS